MRQRMFLLLWMLPLFTCGCTAMLWSRTDYDNKAAINPNLRLFQDGRQKDLLVVYDEYSERTRSVRPRAYLLQKNQQRVALDQQPYFVSDRAAEKLPEVPVFPNLAAVEMNSPPALFAVVSTNTESFAVYSGGQLESFHDLPIYPDPVSRRERDALAPLAITADAVIITGVTLGLLYLYLGAPGL